MHETAPHDFFHRALDLNGDFDVIVQLGTDLFTLVAQLDVKMPKLDGIVAQTIGPYSAVHDVLLFLNSDMAIDSTAGPFSTPEQPG